MVAVRRYDRGELRKPEKDQRTGYLRADGFITKVGVFRYRLKGGKIRRELRLPEEVFHADSIRSFDEAPITNGHPVENLDASNTKKHQVGSVRDPRREDAHMRARLLVTDADTIKQAESGKRDLSCGYTCELEQHAGVTDGIDGIDDGLRYDAIQRNIRGNHVAILDAGRAGGTVSIRLDANDAIMSEEDEPIAPAPKPKETTMDTITKRIDGMDIECTKQGAQAIDKLQAKNDELIENADVVKTETEKQKARADKAEEDLAKHKKDTDAKLAPEAVQKRVDERVKLITDARDVLGEKDADGKEIKLDSMTDVEIKKLVIAKSSDVDLADKSSDYVNARFDSALEDSARRKDGGDDGDRHHDTPKPNPANIMRNPRTDGTTPKSARDKMIERDQKAWQGDTKGAN